MRRPAAPLIGAACALAFVRVASAADLSGWPPVTSARPPSFNWSGCYAGLNAGVAWNHANIATTVDPGSHFSLPSNVALVGAAASGSMNQDAGFIGGAHAGCNWQNGFLVFGVEGDFDALTAKATSTGDTVTTLGPVSVANSVETSWLATVRPRVRLPLTGVAAMPASMLASPGTTRILQLRSILGRISHFHPT